VTLINSKNTQYGDASPRGVRYIGGERMPAMRSGRDRKEGGVEASGGPNESSASRPETHEKMAHYPLLEALLERRSRRFGQGMSLNGGLLPTTAPLLRSL